MDPIADMLAHIKNAQAVRKERISVPFSKVKAPILNVLKETGFIVDAERRKRKVKKFEREYLDIVLRYDESGRPAVSGVKLLSTPSRHLYAKATELRPVRSGYGVAVISTSRGIMSSKEARKQKLGGELLFEIW